MSSPLLLGLDIGTGSTKCVVADASGTIMHVSTRTHGTSMPRPGWFEADAENLWWAETVSLCSEAVAAVGAVNVAGVCVSGLGPALVLTDDALHPVRPAIFYGIDTRAEDQIVELNKRIGEEEIFRVCGKALSTQALGPKLLWVRQHEPEVWTRARHWFGANAFIAARLTGVPALDRHTASQCDPMYDLRGQDWTPWAAEIADHLALPRLVWPTDEVGRVTAEAATLTGLRQGTPVIAGTVDAWAEGFSAGVRRPGDLMLMYGSTLFFVQVLSDVRAHRMLWTTAGIDQGSLTAAAGMSTAGSLLTWVQEVTGHASFDDLVAEAAQVPTGSDGLVMLPYLAGERTPVFDAQARGVLAGISLRHTRGHLFRAAYEGIAFGIRQIVDLFEALEVPQRIVAVGGGTQGGLWTQIVSDVTGREQLVPAQTIGASYGDALMAAIGTGLVPPETNWATDYEVVTPDPRHKARYDVLYDLYRDLYPATAPVIHELAAMQIADADLQGS